ncbi:hypothetical protein N431DRAFT_450896 [Stipitochalara longipes BDJ]|nr:hypothetical protein N431DRAFT_450896 [Stipitochalara longipes BDJ]
MWIFAGSVAGTGGRDGRRWRTKGEEGREGGRQPGRWGRWAERDGSQEERRERETRDVHRCRTCGEERIKGKALAGLVWGGVCCLSVSVCLSLLAGCWLLHRFAGCLAVWLAVRVRQGMETAREQRAARERAARERKLERVDGGRGERTRGQAGKRSRVDQSRPEHTRAEASRGTVVVLVEQGHVVGRLCLCVGNNLRTTFQFGAGTASWS